MIIIARPHQNRVIGCLSLWGPFVIVLIAVTAAIASPEEDVRATVEHFVKAMVDGDRKALDACFAADAPEAREMGTAICNMYAARSRFYKAATKQFGHNNAAHADPLLDASDTVDSLPQADVKVNGDAASVQFGANKMAHLGLVRGTDGWRVNEVSGAGAPRKVALAFYPKMTAALDAVCQEIELGKYSSTREAIEGLKQRMTASTSRPSA